MKVFDELREKIKFSKCKELMLKAVGEAETELSEKIEELQRENERLNYNIAANKKTIEIQYDNAKKMVEELQKENEELKNLLLEYRQSKHS